MGAGIDQEQLPLLDAPIALAGDAVMHDGAVGSCARDCRKRDIFELAGLVAKAFQRFDGCNLSQTSARGLRVDPGEKARDGGAVAAMRGARAFDFDLVLDSLHDGDRIGATRDLAAIAGNQARERIGCRRLVEPHSLFLPPKSRKVTCEIVGLADIGDRFEAVAHFVRQFAAIDIERRAPLLRHDGK